MPTLEELTTRFLNYSDEELFNVYLQLEGYTEEGKEAFQAAVNERGGLDSLKMKISRQQEIENELSRIKTVALNLLKEGRTPDEIKDKIEVQFITREQADQLVEEARIEVAQEKFDLKIKPRTFLGGLIGGLLGGTIGGIGWGIQLVMSKHMFAIFGIGLVILSYGCIRLFTGQSRKNVVVVLLTVLSVIYALVLGQLIFEIWG